MKKPATVRFTEEMHGALGFGAADHRQGWEQGIASTCPFMFHLTISVSDLDRFADDPDHTAPAIGWVRCPPLSDANLPVDYAWGTLRQNSEAHLGRLLEAHGGREYRLVRVRFEGPATPYRTFVVRRAPRITVRDEQGVEREVRLFGSVIERPRAYKLFSYVTD